MTMNVKAMTRTHGLVPLGLAIGFAAASCVQQTSFVNPEHCANQAGDAWCAERYGGDDQPRLFCILGNGRCGTTPGQDGCVPEEPSERECYSPCGDSQNFLEDSRCLGGMETTDGTMSTGETTDDPTSSESSSTTGPLPCMTDEDCTDIGAPFCEPDSGECVRCDGTPDPDGACAALDPDVSLCVGGTCVACTPENPLVCDEQLLLCDPGTNTCAPCTEHIQCEAGACDVFDGRCFDPDHVLHVGMGQPYASITAAVDDVGAMMLDSAVLVLHQGPSFDETATVDTGVLAIVAAEAEQPQWVNTAVMAPTLTVMGAGTRVYLHRVRLTGNLNDLGLLVDGARVDLRRSRIVQNAGGGIVAQNGAELTLRNCFVGGADGSSALRVENASSTVGYSTLGGGTINATGLACVAPGAVEVRNSITVALGNEGTAGVDVDCPSGNITFTATEVPLAGEGNSAVGELPLLSPEDWFVGYGTGDFHLQNDGLTLFADIAQWQLGDPTTDIDGDLRPTMDGTPDYAGADAVP